MMCRPIRLLDRFAPQYAIMPPENAKEEERASTAVGTAAQMHVEKTETVVHDGQNRLLPSTQGSCPLQEHDQSYAQSACTEAK